MGESARILSAIE